MDWLKIIKIKIMILVFCLSSLCFGEDTKLSNYDNLLVAVVMGNFAKFKSLYDKSNVLDVQKAVFIKMADAIIAREKSNWPKLMSGKGLGLGESISVVKGRDLKNKIKKIQSVVKRFTIGGSFIFGILMNFFWDPLLKGVKNCNKNINDLQNGAVQIPIWSNAATEAVNIQSQKKNLLLKVVPLTIGLFGGVFVGGVILGYIQVKVDRILDSYKLFKGATKIKKLIEESSPQVVIENPEIVKVEV